MASEIEAIIFDYDGVVVTLDKELALQAAIPHSQSFLIPAEVVLTDLFYDEAQNYPLDLGQVTIEEVREAMRRIAWKGEVTEWFNWWAFVDDCFRISPPMRELLKYLSERYQLALLTDNHIGFRKWLQHRPDIGQYFDIVVCSAEQKVKKPDSQKTCRVACQPLARLLGIQPCLDFAIVGDTYRIGSRQVRN
ncbi:MAG TPA: HAD family hydrolase [Ktedonobacteraceae bacterium]|nr:HAD family hydrolase [Ktedonobacteraceae bacterium]